MENQLLYFKRGGSEQFVQGETPSQTLTLTAGNFGDLIDFAKTRFTVKVALKAAKDRTKIGSGYGTEPIAAGTVVTVPDSAIVDSGTNTLVIDTEAEDDVNGVTLEEGDIVTVTFEPGLGDEIVYQADNLLSIRQDTSAQTELRFSGYQGEDVVDVITLYHTAAKFAAVTAGVESILNATKRVGVVSFDAQAGLFAIDHVTALGINVAS
tara:strand:+ start:132 stop:758 length:627 start_codon:yes stop_codon:yes gene_type:complete